MTHTTQAGIPSLLGMIDFDDPHRYAQLSEIRLSTPGAIAQAAAARTRFSGFRSGKQVFIIAADHPARGALGAGGDDMAMADRRQLLDHLLIALAQPGCAGILGSPDILDDLLLLGALEGKLVFGSINRAGLFGSSFEFDDRNTGFTPAGISRAGYEGGKILVRIAHEDRATPALLSRVADTIDALAERELYAMIEPFVSIWEGGRVRNLLDPASVALSVGIAQALGTSSAYTWMKLPVVDNMEEVMASTTLPTVLLGGDSSASLDTLYASWGQSLALPGVVGLTVGRTLLYPSDGDVASAVAGAVALLQDR